MKTRVKSLEPCDYHVSSCREVKFARLNLAKIHLFLHKNDENIDDIDLKDDAAIQEVGLEKTQFCNETNELVELSDQKVIFVGRLLVFKRFANVAISVH